MSIKIRQALIESLIKIEKKEFDESTIRTLLIVSREYMKFDGLVKELAHFIAHLLSATRRLHTSFYSIKKKNKKTELICELDC